MTRTFLKLLITVSSFLIWNVPLTLAQTPDAAVKITSRMVAPGIGLSWGDGILTYKGLDYPFTFKATGLFRDVDASITAAELSGQVFNLNNPEDFSGNYQKVETQTSEGAGSRATMKNQKGVVVNLVSTMEGRKFALAREGMDIELKK